MSSGNVPADVLITCLEEKIVCMEEEKSRMEAEICKAKALLSSFRAKNRNSFLLIFRLPPEVLAIIFIHGARGYDRLSRTSDIPSWVNVSYVCSHWRDIALSCPTLWTYHFNVSLRWTQELLHRSKQASLKISCLYPHYRPGKDFWWWSNLLDNLLEHSGRIQVLRLILLPSLLPATLSLSAPRLERLEIHLYQQPDWPLAITDGDTPVLRTLRLRRCPLPWYSLNLSRLNSLSLHRAPIQLNMADFLAVLRGMQNLALLDLEYVLPSARGFLSSGGLGDSPQIDLPHLTLLAVIAPLSTVVALLSCVNIPLKTQLSLETLFERGSSVGDYTPISSFLAQRLSISERLSSSCQIFRSLVIEDCYGIALTFSSLDRDCYPHIPLGEKLGPKIPLKITFGKEDDEAKEREEMTQSDKHRIMSDICCALPLNNVQTLRVTWPQFPSAIWKEILGHLHGVRYMRLSGALMPDLSMLSLTVDEPKENPIYDEGPALGRILVPALEELELFRITFIPDDATPRGGHMSQKSLLDTLSTRKGLRDRLTMIECEVEIESDDDSGL